MTAARDESVGFDAAEWVCQDGPQCVLFAVVAAVGVVENPGGTTALHDQSRIEFPDVHPHALGRFTHEETVEFVESRRVGPHDLDVFEIEADLIEDPRAERLDALELFGALEDRFQMGQHFGGKEYAGGGVSRSVRKGVEGHVESIRALSFDGGDGLVARRPGASADEDQMAELEPGSRLPGCAHDLEKGLEIVGQDLRVALEYRADAAIGAYMGGEEFVRGGGPARDAREFIVLGKNSRWIAEACRDTHAAGGQGFSCQSLHLVELFLIGYGRVEASHHRGAHGPVSHQFGDVQGYAAFGECRQITVHAFPVWFDLVVHDESAALAGGFTILFGERCRAEAAVSSNERRHPLTQEGFHQRAGVSSRQ